MMLQLATRYVEITGPGSINTKDEWTTVEVIDIKPTRSWDKPFDMDALLNNPNPKVFDPDKIVRADEPLDADEFNHYIREFRNHKTGKIIG